MKEYSALQIRGIKKNAYTVDTRDNDRENTLHCRYKGQFKEKLHESKKKYLYEVNESCKEVLEFAFQKVFMTTV